MLTGAIQKLAIRMEVLRREPSNAKIKLCDHVSDSSVCWSIVHRTKKEIDVSESSLLEPLET